MAEQNTEAKLKKLLKQEKIQLWNPPFTAAAGGEEEERRGEHHMKELAERYAALLQLSAAEVGGALESIRVQAVTRGKGNKTFRETNVATLELLLPRDVRKGPKKKDVMETRLDVAVQEVLDRIRDQFGLKHIKLILNGKTLSAERRLDEQNVRNHSKVMVLKTSDADTKQQMSSDEHKRKEQSESLQRTHKGFNILSNRDGSDDPDTTPFLEIADQKGNPLKIPHGERKALILAMGFHEKGRSLMKRKRYDDALCHLLQADQHFSQCDSALLAAVDNFAVLQLDIVWCYRALEALTCLDDGRSRLQNAERCFLRCYGEQRERLLMIKGNTGREEVLFLRLYLLQSLLSYIEGNDAQAQQQLSKVESLYSRLHLDSDKMAELMALGFSEREARLGLRACHGDLQQAAAHISNRRQEREEQRQRERLKRRRRMDDITALTELGFSRRDAARALHHADGDVNRACEILQDSDHMTTNNNNTDGMVSPEKVEQLLYLGFERDASEAALRLTDGDVQSATQLLLENQGVLSPPSTSSTTSSTTSPSSEEPSTSSSSSSTPTEDEELVSEVLEDISYHEEDYLDLTLDEERDLIQTMRGFLRRSTHT